MPDYTRSGTRRAGDDYQDAVALDLFVEALEHPERYSWIEVEAEDAGILDDVCAQRTDGALVLKQVKFSTRPGSEDAELDWEELVQERKGKQGTLPSLLQRFADSLRRARMLGPIAEAALHTNRPGATTFKASLDPSGRVAFEKISPVELRELIAKQLGGEAESHEFFRDFRFFLDQPSLEILEESARRRFERLAGTELGWLSLKEELGHWVKFKNEPAPDGRITLGDIKRAAQWYTLRSLPQAFAIPRDYVPPHSFHEDVLTALADPSTEHLVIFGSPGVGKSTYLSYVCRELGKPGRLVVIRHHYSLSTTDPYARFDHRRVAESLMSQLENACPESLGSLGRRSPNTDQLREWITASGDSLAAKGKRLLLIVDGLDQVWRDAGATGELDELFNHLLPVPPGLILLVGTQRIAPEYLPKRLTKSVPPELWQELPTLDLKAVRNWIEWHANDLELPPDTQRRDVALDVLAGAFYGKTDGHPLHLRFTLRALRERGLRISETNIASLPPCPHHDINEYYRLLWQALSERGKQVLYLLSATDFRWPTTGILDCLAPSNSDRSDVKSALSEVAHLLHDDGFGWLPFHPSIFSYVQDLPEHQDEKKHACDAALEWLKSKAPEYWRWAYEWLLQNTNGDPRPVVSGPDREWLIEAIARWRSSFEVTRILEVGAAAALAEPRGLPRFIELGLYRGYYSVTNGYYDYVTNSLRYCQLRLSEDESLPRRLTTSLDLLKPEEVLPLCEYARQQGWSTVVAQCVTKLNDWPRRREAERHTRVVGEEQSWSAVLVEAAAVAEADLPGVLRFLERTGQNRTEFQHPDELFSVFCEALWRYRVGTLLRRLPQVALPESRLSEALHHLARCACEEGFDASRFLKPTGSAAQGLLASYVLLKSGFSEIARPGYQFATSLLSLRDYDVSLRRRWEVDRLFRDVFFESLAFYLGLEFETTDLWRTRLEGENSWAAKFVCSLIDIARASATRLRTSVRPTCEWLFAELSRIALPEPYESREDWEYFQRARHAAIEISFDLHLLANTKLGVERLTSGDLRAALGSGFAPRQLWMERYFHRRRRLGRCSDQLAAR